MTALAATLHAQAPIPPGNVPPDTVVAKVEGKDITAGEVRRLLENSPPVFVQTFQQNYVEALQSVYLLSYLAQEAEKLKLAERSPWKEQLEFARRDTMANAFFTNERNTYSVSGDDIEAFYTRNQSRYQQAKIKVISIGFKPAVAATATSPQAVADAARNAFEATHAKATRSEAEAKTLAADLVKRIRAGADFVKLVAEYSEDAESKAAGGDFGVVKYNSSYSGDIKKAVFALKPGEVSEPVRQSSNFYIIRVEEKSTQPIAEVRETIVHEIREAHMVEFLNGLRQRFTLKIEKPEFFLQLSQPPKSNPPPPGKQ